MAEGSTVNFKITATDATQAAWQSVKRGLSSVEASVMSLKGAFVAMGPIMAGLGIVKLGKDVIDAADSLNKLSQKTGVSVESLSTLRYAAQLSDVSLEGLAQGLKKLSVNMLDTQADTGEARAAFKALGVEVTDAGGKLRSGEDVMLQIAERFAGMEDGAGKTALAVKLFGKTGSDLIPMLNQGRDGLSALTKEAERLGLKLDTQTAQAAENFNDALTSLSFASKGAAQTFMVQLIPGLTEVANRMRIATIEGGILKGLLEGAREAFGKLVFPGTKEKLAEVNKEIETTTQRIGELEARRPGYRSSTMLQSEYARLSRLYGDQGRLQILSEFDTPANAPGRAKSGAPSLGDGGGAGGARGPKQPTFEELMEKGRLKREQVGQQAEDEATRAAEQLRENNERLARSYRELLDPAEVWRNKMKDLDEQMKNGLNLSQAEYSGLMSEYSRKASEATLATSDLKKETESLNDIARQLGMTFSSAFENALVGGKKVRDMLQGIAQDVLRIFVRKKVTEPAAEFLTKAITGAFAGTIPADVAADYGTAYGPMTAKAPPAQQQRPVNQTLVFNLAAGTPAAVRDAMNQALPGVRRACIDAVRHERNLTGDGR